MLGAQALRTKQKVEQKERERRVRERQKSLELQRSRIQRLADDDARNAILAYINEQGGSLPKEAADGNATIGFVRRQQRNSSCVAYDQVTSCDLSELCLQQGGSASAKARIAKQRHSLNTTSLCFIPTGELPTRPTAGSRLSSAGEQKRASSGDASSAKPGSSSGHRFLRWIGLGPKKDADAKESRRMSTC